MTTKEFLTIEYKDHTLDVCARIEKESFGTFDTPGDDGAIELIYIHYLGVDILWVLQELEQEDFICELIRKEIQ
jgi:hypothetical protein